MVCGIIPDTFRDLTDLHLCIDQIGDGIGHAELLDQRCKAAARVLLDQRTQMRLAVVEEFCQGCQCQCLVIVLDILEDQRKVRAELVVVELHRFTVIP